VIDFHKNKNRIELRSNTWKNKISYCFLRTREFKYNTRKKNCTDFHEIKKHEISYIEKLCCYRFKKNTKNKLMNNIWKNKFFCLNKTTKIEIFYIEKRNLYCFSKNHNNWSLIFINKSFVIDIHKNEKIVLKCKTWGKNTSLVVLTKAKKLKLLHVKEI